MKARLEPDGTVSAIDAGAPPVDMPNLSRCIEEELRKTAFPTRTEATTVVIVMVFKSL